jgi:hypothetical protein
MQMSLGENYFADFTNHTYLLSRRLATHLTQNASTPTMNMAPPSTIIE